MLLLSPDQDIKHLRGFLQGGLYVKNYVMKGQVLSPPSFISPKDFRDAECPFPDSILMKFGVQCLDSPWGTQPDSRQR